MAAIVSQKERLQFDFTPDALERLDALKDKSGAASRAEVVRSALRLYEWFINDVSPDDTIQVLDSETKEVSSAFKAKLLLR